MKTTNKFTNLYKKSITLRFEAIPVNETEKTSVVFFPMILKEINIIKKQSKS